MDWSWAKIGEFVLGENGPSYGVQWTGGNWFQKWDEENFYPINNRLNIEDEL